MTPPAPFHRSVFLLVLALGTFALALTTRAGPSSSASSAFFTIDTRDQERSTVRVKVMDDSGAALPGANVTIRQNGLLIAMAASDPFGSVSLSNLLSGFYELRAERAGYLEQIAPFVRIPDDIPNGLSFILPSPKTPPSLVENSELPAPELLDNPNPILTGNLKLFVAGGNGRFIPLNQTNTLLSTNKMTVILTRGCDGIVDLNSNSWPLLLARALAAIPGLTEKANIIAWDWPAILASADGDLIDSTFCTRPRQNTPAQGIALGQGLWNALGPEYALPLHFIGHGLGTLVNCAAINYLHGDNPKNSVPKKWDSQKTHVTLFDAAGLVPDFRLEWRSVDWAPSVPIRYRYLDNYMTVAGVFVADSVNVLLQRSRYLSDTAIHSYPPEWYAATISDPASSILGFRYSFENQAESAHFPTPSLYPSGPLFAQDEGNPSEQTLTNLNVPDGLNLPMAIEVITHLPLRYELRTTRDTIESDSQLVDAIVAGAAPRKIGDVSILNAESLLNHYGSTASFLNAEGTTPAVLGIPGFREETAPNVSWSLDFKLQTHPPGSAPAYIWFPVHVPREMVAVMFDFRLSGDGSNDRVIAGINSSNLFSLETRFIPSDIDLSSGPLGLGSWAGQDAELFFGLAGGSSTNALLSIHGIRFLYLPLPQLVIEQGQRSSTISWTESAPGFKLETAPGLVSPTWSPATNVFGYTGHRIITNDNALPASFYRLRRE